MPVKNKMPCYRRENCAMRPIAYMGALKFFGSPCIATPVAPDRPCWGQPGAEALSYSAVKLFSKNYNLCDHDT